MLVTCFKTKASISLAGVYNHAVYYRSWHFHASWVRSQLLDTSMMRLWWSTPDEDSDSLTAAEDSSRPLLYNTKYTQFATYTQYTLYCY